jgi:hypothetical protein
MKMWKENGKSKIVTEYVGLAEISKLAVREVPMIQKKKIQVVRSHLQLKCLLFMWKWTCDFRARILYRFNFNCRADLTAE